MTTITENEFKDGMMIDCKVGDTIQFKFNANQTTGYVWKAMIPNDGRIQMDRNEYVPTQPIRIGSGGVHYFEIKLTRAGKSKVMMENCKPGQRDPNMVVNFDIKE